MSSSLEGIYKEKDNKYIEVSKGGKLMFVKLVLKAISIYWHTLAYTQKGILEKIMKISFKFLWFGNREREHFSNKMASNCQVKREWRIGL